MNTLLYEPAEGDPRKVIAPQFPFCYPPTVHRHADWVPMDGWRQGPARDYMIDGQDGMNNVRQALVLIWKGEFLSDSYRRLYDVMKGIEKQVYADPGGLHTRYPDMGALDANWNSTFLSKMGVREKAPEWIREIGDGHAYPERAWCLARGAVKCIRGNLIEWEAP